MPGGYVRFNRSKGLSKPFEFSGVGGRACPGADMISEFLLTTAEDGRLMV
jgi:hypothetical protein